MKNRQQIMLTQPGPITSTVELSQLSTMSSYLYNRVPKVQWSQPLQHNFDPEPATSASADNPEVTFVSLYYLYLMFSPPVDILAQLKEQGREIISQIIVLDVARHHRLTYLHLKALKLPSMIGY